MADPTGNKDPGALAALPVRVNAIRIPPDLEISAASRLVSDSAGPKAQAARRMVTAAAMHGIDLSLTWGTVDRSADGRPVRVRQACLAVPGSGRTAMLVLSGPGAWPAAHEHAERVASVNAACEFLATAPDAAGREIRLAQALPEPREAWAARALIEAGFRKVGELAYLKRAMTDLPEVGPRHWPDGIEIRPVRDAKTDAALLITGLERSYEATLDCPELCGLRETGDVLESHRATGVFDARLWWLVMQGGEAHGCMLFNNCPDHGSVELVYLGVSPELRGKGIGGALLRMGLAALRSVSAEQVTCAVDLRNVPAQRLYARMGFHEFGRRIALVRPLPRA